MDRGGGMIFEDKMRIARFHGHDFTLNSRPGDCADFRALAKLAATQAAIEKERADAIAGTGHKGRAARMARLLKTIKPLTSNSILTGTSPCKNDRVKEEIK